MTKEEIKKINDMDAIRTNLEKVLHVLEADKISLFGQSFVSGPILHKDRDADLIEGFRAMVQEKYDKINQEIEAL